jgi:hypothetical protein
MPKWQNIKEQTKYNKKTGPICGSQLFCCILYFYFLNICLNTTSQLATRAVIKVKAKILVGLI